MTDEAENKEPEEVNVFDTLNKASKEQVETMVTIMCGTADERVDRFVAMKDDPTQIGTHYAAFARYVVAHTPYRPDMDSLDEIIGFKIGLLTEAVEAELDYGYIWALDSSILSDITMAQMMKVEMALQEASDDQEKEPTTH